MPRFHFFLRLATASSLFALSPSSLGAQGARDDEPVQHEVKKLAIRGVKSVDQSELESNLATSASHCKSLAYTPFCAFTKSHFFYEREYLDEAEFKRDVLRIKVFYFKRGYRQTEVDTAVSSRRQPQVTVTFNVTEGPATILAVDSVLQPGNILRDRDVRRLVALKAGKPFDLLKLDSSVVRLRNAMFDRGYGDAIVRQTSTVDDSTHRATLTFTIEPRAKTTVASIEVCGNREVSEQVIRNSLSFREGDVFRLRDLTESQRSLYESSLFGRASLAVVKPDSLVCRAVGGGTGFSGGTRADSVAWRARRDSLARVAASAGAPNERTRHDSTARASSALPDSAKVIAVRVREAPMRDARVSAGFNTVDFFQVDTRFTHYYWLRSARRLDLQATVGNLLARPLNGVGLFHAFPASASEGSQYYAPTYLASANVTQRWFQSPKNSIGAGIFAHRRSSPGIYVDEGYGTNATLTRNFGPRAPVSVDYRFEITKVEASDVYFCVNFGVCENGGFSSLSRSFKKLSPLSLTATWDQTDLPFTPTKGFIAKGTLEHASAFTLSQFRYNRAFADGSIYHTIGRRNVLAGHLRLGIVNPLASTSSAAGVVSGNFVHPRKRFYAGGSQSVRGYGENQLGPKVLTIPSSTLRGRMIATTNGVVDTTYRFCDPSIPIAQCDPNPLYVGTNNDTLKLRDGDFQTRPLGGNSLLEGSVELRFPIWRDFGGAVFVDAGVVGGGSIATLGVGTGAITPGAGLRYRSPVGPIRIDVGYNPYLKENLEVVTENDVPGSNGGLVTLGGSASGTDETKLRHFPDDPKGGFRGFLNRLTLHLSIGEAF